jgi:hypothetical protein
MNCHFRSKKYKKSFTAANFFQVLVIKTLDSELNPDPNPYSDPQCRKNAGSGSALNQCGSTTLHCTQTVLTENSFTNVQTLVTNQTIFSLMVFI